MNIRRLIEIQAYRGIRHRRNLPVRASGRTPTRVPQGSAARRGRGQEEGPGQEGLVFYWGAESALAFPKLEVSGN